MSSHQDRALERLAQKGAVLAPRRTSRDFGVFVSGDRRRRPVCRLTNLDVRELETSGAIVRVQAQDTFVISSAGIARATRANAPAEEAFAAQHRAVVARPVMDSDGAQRIVRGHDADAMMRKLAALRDADGKRWLSVAELDAAARLRADWQLGEIGLLRGSDLMAPPKGSSPRGAGNALERRIGAQCDARRRVAEALQRLSPPLRRLVEAVCLKEEGVETFERLERWPARSGKLALKLALAQLSVR